MLAPPSFGRCSCADGGRALPSEAARGRLASRRIAVTAAIACLAPTSLRAVGGDTMAYQPQWLRLSEALDFLERRGSPLAEAKAFLVRAIQDRLHPRGPPGMFCLPGWRPIPRSRDDRSWITTPNIDWTDSTIVAPRHPRGMHPTLIEVSADELNREFPDYSTRFFAGLNAVPLTELPVTTSPPASQERSKPRQEPVLRVLSQLWPQGPPPDRSELPNAELCKKVHEALPEGVIVSDDSILRAAGRRK
jgi:hypothetical protein